ncbi:MAG: neutral/alkaline non-lysosomal ceramidase N-terminal domain-containing protein [Lentisphaeria bacterium]
MKNSQIRFGLGRRCTNPELPVSLAGYFNIRMWDRVLDDLEVRVLVMEKGGQKVALIQYDLVTVTTTLYDYVLAAIQKEFGQDAFTPCNLILTATHSHTAPEIRLSNRGSSKEYYPLAVQKTLEALSEALSNLQDGTLYATLTRDARFIFNRRYWMKDGTVVTNPGKGNPDIARPEGEIDPEIPMLVIKKDGRPFVVIPSIVNHTDTIGGCGVSADWPGFLHRIIEKQLAPGAMLLPLIGCQGNINHFDVNSQANQTCYAEAERIGTGYAQSIEKALSNLQEVAFDKIRICHDTVTVETRQLSKEEISEAEAVMARYPEISISRDSAQDLTSEDLARKTPFALKYFASHLLEMNNKVESRCFLLTGFELGNAFIASMPSEPFTEHGLRVRKSCFPNHLCLIAALANGTGGAKATGGYIPNTWNYNRGGYETTPRSNPFAANTGELIIAAWQRLAKKLKDS